ncbi:MAG: PAS domain-containing protein [Candidatus Riflebacteria bacterium]|nr:PAS domain-containing protein [Candidatus Riflebacteria bacterium]
MIDNAWLDGFSGAITVSDKNGKIIFMNSGAKKTFQTSDTKDWIGKNLFDCHPETAQKKLREIMDNKSTNVYTIEKKGKKKIIWQAPWFEKDNEFAGLIEFSLEIPFEMPHFVRK